MAFKAYKDINLRKQLWKTQGAGNLTEHLKYKRVNLNRSKKSKSTVRMTHSCRWELILFGYKGTGHSPKLTFPQIIAYEDKLRSTSCLPEV